MCNKLGLCSLLIIFIAGCGGGGGESSPSITIPPVDQPPPVVVEPPVIVEPPVVVEPTPEPPVVVERQMSRPRDCSTVASFTGDPVYKFVTCDGVLIRSDIDFPYDPESKEVAIIDLLAVVDTKLDVELDGGTYEEFAQREVALANKLFADSGVYIKLRITGIKLVEVSRGDLFDQIERFGANLREFSDMDKWQKDAGADIAFLFKKIEETPLACGVARYNDLTREMKYRRGVSQCHINTVFQETEVTRYYERAHETFTHEVGHILGMDHNIESRGTTSTLFPFSFGYLVRGYDRKLNDYYNGYGTIMSYSDLPTGRFSDMTKRFIIPETGTSERLGWYWFDGNRYADGVAHLNRVRYYMSQLHEMYDGEESPALLNASGDADSEHICLY